MTPFDKPTMVIFRSMTPYYANVSDISFYTTPFLPGVGCGGGGLIDVLAEAAATARSAGYTIRIVCSQGSRRGEYPLDPRDRDALMERLMHAGGEAGVHS